MGAGAAPEGYVHPSDSLPPLEAPSGDAGTGARESDISTATLSAEEIAEYEKAMKPAAPAKDQPPQTIPYERFREVNERAKGAEARAQQLEGAIGNLSQQNAHLQQQMTQLLQSMVTAERGGATADDLDPAERRVRELEAQIAQNNRAIQEQKQTIFESQKAYFMDQIQRELREVQKDYPLADADRILMFMDHDNTADMRSVAKYLHQKEEAKARHWKDQGKKELLEHSRQKATAPRPVRGGTTSVVAEPAREGPKDLSRASARALEMLRDWKK